MEHSIRGSVFIATSLDGFIAREDGALDWLPGGDVEDHGYNEFMASVDALVMGRKTFETVLGFPEWPFGAKPVIVLSSTPSRIVAPSGDPSVCQRLAFSHGVVPVDLTDEPDDWREFARRWLRENGITAERVMLVAGPSPRNPNANHRIELMHVAMTR